MNILSPITNTSGNRGTATNTDESVWHFLYHRRAATLFGILFLVLACADLKLLPNKKQCFRELLITTLVVVILNWKIILQAALSLSIRRLSAYYFTTLLIQTATAAAKYGWSRVQPSFEYPESDNVLKPMLFECRTTHTRLFPTTHSFSYSYLYVGIPVEWTGSATTLLSTNSTSGSQAWFHVHSDDYLMRGSRYENLETKLRAYLESQDISFEQHPHAYLVTAPRVLGFSFNPVSFWYLYNPEKILSAMILEVNNTFDERRMYFLKPSLETSKPALKFTSSWAKDFHVSPFNDRDGFYSLSTQDPFHHNRDDVQVDNTIVLQSNEGKPKIIARIYSTEAGSNPMIMSNLQNISFLLRWWWVGFMTNPRILREARTLWVKKLQVFYRPEVLFTSIGRNETAEEQAIEPCFRACMQQMVDLSGSISVNYFPAAGQDQGKTITLKPRQQRSKVIDESQVELRILTPAFYAEVVRASSLEEAFRQHGFETNQGQCMLDISNIEIFQDFLQQVPVDETRLSYTNQELMVVHLRQHGLVGMVSRFLRQRFSKDSSSFQPSDLDRFMKRFCTREECKVYYSTVLQILLADRIALGFVPLLKTYIFAINMTVMLLVARNALPSQQLGMVIVLVVRFLASLFVEDRT